MSISRVRMVDFISEESSIAFEKEYIKRARGLVPNALNLILTRTGPESLLNIAVYQNQEDVDSSFKATEDFMATMSISRVRMVDFISEESSITFEKKA